MESASRRHRCDGSTVRPDAQLNLLQRDRGTSRAGSPDPPSIMTGVDVKLVARFRTPEGRIVRVGLGPEATGMEGERSRRMTPPPEYLVQPAASTIEAPKDEERDPWWFLRLFAQEAYQRHF